MSSNELYNNGPKGNGEDSINVNQVECMEVDRRELVNEALEEDIDEDHLMDKETDKYVSNNVVNIFNRVLTQAEISLLSKGLKICPTPKKLDWSAIKRDVKEFCGKIKCRAYFEGRSYYGVEESRQNFKQFKEKSTWVPSEIDLVTEVYCSKLEERISAINTGVETTVIFRLRKQRL